MPLGNSGGATTAKKSGGAKASPKATPNNVEWDVFGRTAGITKVEGEVDFMNESIIRIRRRKRQSSKYALQPIPVKKIVAIRGEIKVGKFVQIAYESPEAAFMMLKKASVDGFNDKLGLLTGTDKDGRPFAIRPDVAITQTASDIAAATAPPIKF